MNLLREQLFGLCVSALFVGGTLPPLMYVEVGKDAVVGILPYTSPLLVAGAVGLALLMRRRSATS